MIRAAAAGLLAGLTLAAPAAAQAPDGLFDARARDRAAVAAGPAESVRRPTVAMRRARAALERSLGPRGVLDVDALTGTPRMLARLDGTLTGPRAGDPAELAQRYVRANLAALGLTPADLGSLGGLQRVPLAGGGEQVRWRQFHSGVPALDNELRVALTGEGEVLSVVGAPQHDLEPALGAPRLGAAAALRAAGARHAAPVVSGPSGPRRETRFAGGDHAALVVFGEGDRARLAWRVLHRASSVEALDVVVDAGSGRVLRQANLVKRLAPVNVVERYPGSPRHGDFADTSDFVAEGWLAPGARTLDGTRAHVWADEDDDDALGAGEAIAVGNPRFTGFGACGPGRCSWSSDAPGSWRTNRDQNAHQLFHYVNTFGDWLADELGFALGDELLVHADDGAATGPDAAHLDDANLFTPPAGGSPVMQMYLFDGARDVNGGDDAAIVYHEYAHGLTSRLVTDGDGWGALNSPQAGAMGEGFSDFYAMDFLEQRGFEVDTGGAGDVDLGEYVGGARRQAIDCPVARSAARCPGGGRTYGDFGRVGGVPEVHDDGEIWAQTLWDLRGALGPADTRALVTEALRQAPPEPSFLDLRNAILLADGGAHRAAIWEVFRLRGMGWYASTTGSSDVNPVASVARIASGSAAIAGTVEDFDTGRPLRARVRIGGHDARFFDDSDAAGAFSIGSLAPGTYGSLTATAGDGHDSETLAGAVAPSTRAFRLRRNWAAANGGAAVASVSGAGTVFAGCSALEAIDQDAGTGWSSVKDSSPPVLVVQLPQLVQVAALAVDPGYTCADAHGSTTTRLALGVSEDGQSFQERVHTLAPAAAHVRTPLPLGPASGRVRSVRVRLLEAADPNAPYIDLTELSVYGNGLPAVVLAAPTSAQVGQAIALSAAGSRDPDGSIVRYEWDFDASGTVDRTTAGPATTVAYAAPGTYGATVTAVDERGGRNSATRAIAVGAPPLPSPPPAPPPPELDDPRILLPGSGRRGRVSVRVRCAAACSGTARLTVSRRLARRLGLGRSRTVGRARVRLAAAGERRVRVKLTRKVLRRMRRERVRRVAVRLSVSVRDAGGRRDSARRNLRVRR